MDHWDQQGFGVWVLRDAATGEFVGRGGLEVNDIDGSRMIEVAWAVMPRHWNEGFATELAHVSVRMAFDRLELSELVAITMPTNGASRRVMEKSGFSHERDFVHAGLAHGSTSSTRRRRVVEKAAHSSGFSTRRGKRRPPEPPQPRRGARRGCPLADLHTIGARGRVCAQRCGIRTCLHTPPNRPRIVCKSVIPGPPTPLVGARPAGMEPCPS
jgi:hypothetical protein